MSERRFTARQEAFCCQSCGEEVTPLAEGTYRDHCPRCLFGKHVDVNPGDRAADCGGALEPVGLVGRIGREQILYRCCACGAERRNRPAPDDDPDRLVELASRPAPLRRR